jgi:hypothetical protein
MSVRRGLEIEQRAGEVQRVFELTGLSALLPFRAD